MNGGYYTNSVAVRGWWLGSQSECDFLSTFEIFGGYNRKTNKALPVSN